MSSPHIDTDTPPQDGCMPIAIVGLAFRGPGEATNDASFWDMISKGHDAHSTWPKDRFNIDAFYHPDPERSGTVNTREGHFMKSDVIGFDAPFFSISAKEAHALDPQHRLALELTYESLENAGITIQDVAGSNTGCYMACFSSDSLRLRAHDPEAFPLYEGTGNSQTLLSARISWFFDLKGPSFILDTACSSSLVALHLACQSIRSGETSQAIVGGVNLMFTPEMPMLLSSLHFLSPDGRSKAFDASADGYGRGEGAAVIIVKSLDAALRDGNVIRAVIRGSGVNQDGRTPGITVPSAESQEQLIRSTYAEAGLDFRNTQYFEAHGTGTPVGDPRECSAIGATFGQCRPPEQPNIVVGSVKTNIGHLEAAAGLAGLIKAVYCVEKGQIPPNLLFKTCNPRIDLEGWKLKIPTDLLPWPTNGLRRASINSFGYGGTNAHVIVDDAANFMKSRGLRGAHNTVILPLTATKGKRVDNGVDVIKTNQPTQPSHVPPSPSTPISETSENSGALSRTTSNGSDGESFEVIHIEDVPPQTPRPRLLVWSSHEQKGTEGRAATLLSYLNEREDSSNLLDRLAFTLSNKRSRFQWRSFAVVSSLEAAQIALTKPRKPLRALDNPVVSFVFTGQGAQWYAMGKELMTYQVYRESMEAAAAYFKTIGAEWNLIDELKADESASRVADPTISQPACTALQVALVDLLADWNVRPSVVVGHSSGEIAAAYVTGAITRESAWMVSFHRGHLSSSIATEGAMLAVGLGESEATAAYINRVKQIESNSDGVLVVACINSPLSVSVSGDARLVDKLHSVLDEEQIFNRKLAVERAYHSPHMASIADEYLSAMRGLEEMNRSCLKNSAPSPVRMFSSVTGDLVDAESLAEPTYWVSNLLNPVRFSQAMTAALSHSTSKRRTTTKKAGLVDTIIEIGPHAGLQGPIKQILDARDGSKSKADIPYASVLIRKTDARKSALEALGVLFQRGSSADIARANNPLGLPTYNMHLTNIPPITWNRSIKYWHESALTRAYRFRGRPRHDLLGALSEYSTDAEPSWRNYLRVNEVPWIEHHLVQGSMLYPFAGMLAMAIEAVRQTADTTNYEIEGFYLRDISAGAALVIPHDSSGKEQSVETKLQLRPWRLGSKSLEHKWLEFTISSRNSEGSWTQNCAGLVTVKYRAPHNPIFPDEAESEATHHRVEYHKIANAELPRVPTDDFYSFVAKQGVQLGPSFQALTYIGYGCYEAHCELTPTNTKAMQPFEYEHDHIIHPTTLDGVVQMAALTASAEAMSVGNARIPRFIENVYVSAKVANYRAGQKMVGYARSKRQGRNESIGMAVVADPDWNEPLVVLEGCQTVSLESLGGEQTASSHMDTAALESLRKVGSRHRWGVDVELTKPDTLTSLLLRSVDDISEVSDDVVRELEQACFIICKRASKKFSNPKSRRSFAPHHQLFFEYMQRQVERATYYALPCQPQRGDGSGLGATDWLTTSNKQDDEVFARVAAASIDGKLVHRVGVNLDRIFTGELEPLQVLREDDLLGTYYRTALGTDRIQSIIAQYVLQLSHKRPLRILEIGAGTGATTAVVLPILGNQAEAAGRIVSYTFTDISSGFFEKAAENFKEWSPFLEFRVLNIENEPVAQGFEAGAYDLVIASNVLHATSSIAASLKHCREMLKPGGMLVLEEVTTKLARVPLVVGVLQGWWAGEDDGRKEGPLISEAEWEKALRDQGFSGLQHCFRDSTKHHYLKSFMVSVADGTPPLPAPPRHIVIIKPNLDDDSVDSLTSKLFRELEKYEGTLVEEISLVESRTADLKRKSIVVVLEANTPFLVGQMKEEDFDNIKHVILKAESILWLTRGGSMESTSPEANAITGLARTVRGENPNIRLTTLDLDPTQPIDSEKSSQIITTIIRAKQSPSNTEFEYALRDGQVHVPRLYSSPELSDIFRNRKDSQTAGSNQQPPSKLLPLKQFGNRALALNIKTPGALDTLQYVDDPFYAEPLADHDVEITLKAISMNFHDVMFSMGYVDPSPGDDDGFGAECAGVISRIGKAVTRHVVGDRVLACRIGSWRTYVRNHETVVQKIPDSMSFAEAASFPSVYGTAIFSLVDIARLQKGESVLIHAASGGFGQASIVMARHLGASAVYCTVGSEAKKRLLMEAYGIPEEQILNSRDLSFAAGIKRLTNGRGVDVVLNSLSGEALRQTWLCLAPFGRFIELGRQDMFGNTGLDMTPFLCNRTFAGVNMRGVFYPSPLAARVMEDIMRYHRQGVVKPLQPLTVMNFSQTEEAFRTMQSGKHMGKIVLVPHNDDLVPMVPPIPKETAVSLRPDGTYFLPGGLGGLGRSVATWMAARGARYIVFTSRTGDSKPEAQALLKQLEEQGVTAKAYACDVSDRAEFARILSDMEQSGFPPVVGTVTLAMQIQDVFFENMTASDFQAAARPKVDVTRNMHDLLPKDLDFFICMSSVAGVVGSRGQGNYNAGNTYQDAMARHRRSQGLKGTSIDLGIVEDIGFASDKGVVRNFLTKGAAIWLTSADVLTMIAAAIAESLSSDTSSPQFVDNAEAVVGLATGGLIKAGGHDDPYWFHEARFASVRVHDTQAQIQGNNNNSANQDTGSGAGTWEDIRVALATAKNEEEAAAVALGALKRKLARAMMMDEVDLDPENPANAYGIDSLVAVEIRSWVFKELRSEVSVFEILSNASLTSLAGVIAGRSAVVKGGGEDE